jgi:hypothetical protein
MIFSKVKSLETGELTVAVSEALKIQGDSYQTIAVALNIYQPEKSSLYRPLMTVNQ